MSFPKEVNLNQRKFHTPGQSHLRPRPKNAVFISAGISIKHELSKCVGAIMIQRVGDIKNMSSGDLINTWIENISDEINEMALLKEPNVFLTEACPNDRPKRRIDLVNVTTMDEFEFETDHKIKKDGAVTIYI